LRSPIRNPILRGFNPDPSICRVGDDYYIATSTFEWYPGVQIFHSRNLRDWTLVPRPLNEARLLDLTGVPDSCGIWAPCLSWADGKFWLCYTVVRRFDGDYKDAHNYVTTCETIDGRWSDPEYMNSSGFDPSLFHDDDGRKWHVNMMWSHRPGQNRFAGIVMQEYSPTEQRLVGEIRNIFSGSDLVLTEGPHLYRIGGYYYLLTAEGGTGYEHACTLARSRDIGGPYELHPDKHLITAIDHPDATLQRTGHGAMVETPDGEWYLTHLCGRPIAPDLRRCPMGRESALQKLRWDDDGWPRLADPEHALVAATDHPLTAQHFDFDDGRVPTEFQWLRIPDLSRIVDEGTRPGWLRLIGRESPGSLFESALVARRQQHFNYDAETCMEFAPQHIQQMAGLIAWYNGHKFFYLHLTRNENGERELAIMSCQGDQSTMLDYPEGGSVVLPDDSNVIWMRYEVRTTALQFFYSLDGTQWTAIGPVLDASILSDESGKTEHGNFTGAFTGLACQDVSGQALHADFDYFEYREKD
jgi:xylan 1,4-beta-xylosidase